MGLLYISVCVTCVYYNLNRCVCCIASFLLIVVVYIQEFDIYVLLFVLQITKENFI